MGMSDLPEMYAQSPRVQPEDCRHTFQANHKYRIYLVKRRTFNSRRT